MWSGACSNCALNLRNQHFCRGWKICFFLWNVIRISNSYSFYYNEQMSFSIQTIKTQFKPQTYVKSDAMHQYTSTGQLLAEQCALKLCWECLISDKYSIFIFPNNFYAYVFSCLPPPPTLLPNSDPSSTLIQQRLQCWDRSWPSSKVGFMSATGTRIWPSTVSSELAWNYTIWTFGGVICKCCQYSYQHGKKCIIIKLGNLYISILHSNFRQI